MDVWRAVPTVNDVKLTGPDGAEPLAARPEPHRRLPAGCARRDAAGAGAGRAHQSRAGPERARRSSSWTTCTPSSACCSRTTRVRALSDAIDAGTTPLPDPDPPLNALEQQGKVVFDARVRAVPRRARPVDAAGARRPIPRHREPVPAAGRYRLAGALRLRALPAAPRPQRADVRDHAGERHDGPSHELRSRARAADGVRGRAAAAGRLEQVRRARRCAASARPRRTSTTTARPRSKRSWTTTSSSSSG